MTSKEALKLLYSDAENYAYFNETEEDLSGIKAEYELIKQDLERLETLISILQKFIDEEEYFVLHDKYLSLGIDGSINITQQQCDVLKSVLNFKE